MIDVKETARPSVDSKRLYESLNSVEAAVWIQAITYRERSDDKLSIMALNQIQ